MSEWILRGTKRKRANELLTGGLTRPSNAWFRYTTLDTEDALHASLTLCFYFGISLDGVAQYSDYSGPLYEFYAEKPDLIPVVVFTQSFLQHVVPNVCAYDVVLPCLVARSLPYTKVAVAGKLGPFRDVQVLAPSLEDIASAERELVGIVAPLQTERFYTRVHNWPASAISCPPSPPIPAAAKKGLEIAVICERLAYRLLPDFATMLIVDS